MKPKTYILIALLLMLCTMAGSAKKVHTLGDSTMATYDENATNTRGWGMYFGNFLTNGWTSVNYARGGRDSRGGYNELWNNAKNNVQAGDYVLIQFAHNDEKYNGIDNLELQAYYTSKGDATNAAAVKSDGRGTTPSTTYKQCLKQIVDAVKEKGATPVLVSAVCRCYFGSDNRITRAGRHDLGDRYDAIVNGELKTGLKIAADNHTMDYSYQMQQLAAELDVAFIDMTTATKELYESYGNYDKCYAAMFDKGGEKDNTHYNLTGALTAARLCAQLMKEKGILADDIFIPTELSITPTTVDLGEGYLGKTAMKELTLSGLGLEPAAGTITVTASDGIMLSTDKQNWQNALELSYQNGSIIKTFHARVSLTAVGRFNGTITATQGNNNIEVPVTINVVELGGGEPFTVTWPMVPNDEASVTGDVIAAAAQLEGLEKYGNVNGYGALIAPTGNTGAWPSAGIDDSPNQYVQFSVTAPEGKKLDISNLSMRIKAQGGGALQCHVYYSTDGFVTRKTMFSSGVLNGTWNDITSDDVIKVEEGEKLLIRVYPWSQRVDNGRWICISDVVVGGQVKDAAGVNITGTIYYKLDKGGLNQGDDVVFDPETLSAGFAGKKWSAGASLTVDGTIQYVGQNDEKTIQTKIYNGTDGSFSSSRVADNALTLTLTPEDGFTFVPSKVSFKAARYGTDGGNIGAAVAAGADEVVLVENAPVNRGGKNLDIASFSEPVDGITATADNPMELSFYFLNLGKTKSMGISDVVVEGQLVGAATQVTKYVLTTLVLPSAEAGSISRDPDFDQYKEGTTVTLKAIKNFGYRFKEWQDETGAVVGNDAIATVTMDGAKTMKAVFEPVPVYKVSTKVTNDAERTMGSVTLSPNEHDGLYEAGTRIVATANESKILKFLSWTDGNENANSQKERELTVNNDMELVANFEVQDFIAVFDASSNQSYAYPTTTGYPFAADETWDAERNAKSSVVKVSDGSLCYTKDGGTPVVRNREGVVISAINGLYQNGYRTSDIAFQYQFSTKGFTSATFTADMCAKNAATKKFKALISVNGADFTELKAAWDVTANAVNPIELALPDNAIGQESVVIRITGVGDEVFNTNYPFDKQFDGLDYCDHSESGVGNVFVLGEAVVETDEEAPVVTATIPADNAVGVSATGKITISFNERIEAAEAAGKATLDGKELLPVWSSRSVSFDYAMLDYGTPYTFIMPANFVQDRSGNKLGAPVQISFTTMQRPTVAKGMYDFIVPDDGTITEALNAANNRAEKNVRYRVFIKNGNHVFDTNGTTTGGDGKPYPDPRSHLRAPNTSFIGESMEGVTITNQTPAATWDNGYGAACPLEGIGKGDVLIIEGTASNSYFQNLTLKSSMGDAHGRDIVLHDYSTHTIFKDACIWAYQDTYVSNKQDGAYYFEGGVIRGRTDFICGSGDVFFNKVDIIMCEKGGYIVAPQGNSKYGYVFKDCTISGGASGVDGTYYLGRAWSAAAEAYFINTIMKAKPAKVGWHDWNNGPTRFAEYNSVDVNGVAIDLSNRATSINGTPNSPILSAEEAAVIGDMTNTFGEWQPTLMTEQAPIPSDFTASDAMLTWADSDYALLWAVCKDGNVVAFTTEPTYTVTESGTYTVRAANEAGGLSKESKGIFISEEIISGISEMADEESHISNAVYDLQGRRVNPHAKKGIYIVNGRKVVRH